MRNAVARCGVRQWETGRARCYNSGHVKYGYITHIKFFASRSKFPEYLFFYQRKSFSARNRFCKAEPTYTAVCLLVIISDKLISVGPLRKLPSFSEIVTPTVDRIDCAPEPHPPCTCAVSPEE